MKVLVTNNTLRDIGGSETYAYALIDELNKREDIEVHGFSKNLGYVGKLLDEKYIKIINNVVEDYDFVFASHITTIPYIQDITGFKVQTCHGIYPREEQPNINVDAHASISEEVKQHLTSKGFNSEIIHNGIDCDRFCPIKPINKNVKTVLSLAQSATLNVMIANVCNRMGIKFMSLNKFVNPIFDVEKYINEADMVISLGRGVYESMACGRNIVILDKRPYVPKPPIGDGIITENNIEEYIKFNCSGRYSSKVYTEKDIENEIKKYDQSLGDFTRSYALENLNIVKQVDKYFKLMK